MLHVEHTHGHLFKLPTGLAGCFLVKLEYTSSTSRFTSNKLQYLPELVKIF